MKQKVKKDEYEKLIKEQESLSELLREVGPVLRGSVVILGIKCNNSNCKCAKGEKHPSVYFSMTKEGKTHLVYLGKKLQSQAEEWVTNYKRLRNIIDKLTIVNLKIIQHQGIEGK